MASNSKLTPSQKETLRILRAGMPRNTAFGQSGRVTVLAQTTGNVVKFSTAVASPDEKKIRRKVGEYYAAERWNEGSVAVMPVPRSFDVAMWSIGETAEYIAELLDNGQ